MDSIPPRVSHSFQGISDTYSKFRETSGKRKHLLNSECLFFFFFFVILYKHRFCTTSPSKLFKGRERKNDHSSNHLWSNYKGPDDYGMEGKCVGNLVVRSLFYSFTRKRYSRVVISDLKRR